MTETSEPVVGLFIKLPISHEDVMTIRRHIMSSALTNDGIVEGLKAIAIPVRSLPTPPDVGSGKQDSVVVRLDDHPALLPQKGLESRSLKGQSDLPSEE